MAKRINNKKLLFGLGTTLGITSVATLMGLGVNALATYDPNGLASQVANFANGVNPVDDTYPDVSQNPFLEKVEASMFKKLPTGLERFHFGNVQTGATMTPLGWLGVTKNNEVILTSWSGEVLWKTANMGNTIRSLRYDATMNRVNVYMSSGETGLFQYNGSPNQNTIAAINATTGALIWKPSNLNNAFNNFATTAYNLLKSNGWLDLTNNNQKWKGKNLYNFDSTSNSGNTILSWIPNFMLMNQGDGRLVKLSSLLDGFDDLIKYQFILKDGSFNGGLKSINLKANLIKGSNGVQLKGNELHIPTGDIYIDLNYTYLLTSPFFILNNEKSADVHFFFATHDGNEANNPAKNVRPFHLSMEINFDNSGKDSFNTFQIEKLGSNVISLPTDPILNTKAGNHFFQEIDNLNSKLVTTSPANMIVNRNMFDQNLVTFAYPYANSKPRDQGAYDTRGQTVPTYNVAQIRFNKQGLIDTSSGKLKTLNFNIGQQYLLDPASNTSSWPANDVQSVELNTNRLLTVSPFDNSFTYGSMLSQKGSWIDSNQYNPNASANNFFPMWVVSGYQPNPNSGLKSLPLLIPNQGSLGGQIDGNMSDMNSLRQNGLIFIPSDPDTNELNLYFNLSGGDNRASFGGPSTWTSTKVGALNPMTWDTYSRFNQSILEAKHRQTISRDHFATIVHDRANIEQWYPRTKFSLEVPANTLGANRAINNGDKGGRVTIDANLKLRDFTGSTGTAQVVDLVSHYQKTTLSEQLRDNLPVINPAMATTGKTFSSNQIEVRTTLNVKNKFSNWYSTNLGANGSLFNYGYNQTVSQTSWMVYGQIGKQTKLTNMVDRFGSFSANQNIISTQDVINPTWWDAKKGAFNHETMNNNIIVNGIQPARVLLQIVEPNPSAKPDWMQTFDQKVWEPAPLTKDRYNNESDFNTILQLYMNEVSAKINNQSTSKWSIANLEIRAFLGPNPHFAKDGEIWTFKDQTIMQAKSDNSFVVFDLNKHQSNNGTIYKQMATSYQEMQNQGYGSAVANLIRPNWTNLPTNKKLMFDMPILGNTGGWEQLKWPILRKGESFNNTDPILKTNLVGNQLELKPINNDASEWNWLKFLLQNLNYKYGMFLVIEGWTGTTWNPIDSAKPMYNDAAITQATDEQSKTIRFNFNLPGASKIRLRLVPLTTQHNNDPNQFIQWESQAQITNGNANYKLLSMEYPINANRLIIDPNIWFNDPNLKLSAANQFLNTLNLQDLKTYVDQFKTKFLALNNNNSDLWNKLDLSFNLAGQTISGSLSNDQVLNNLLGKIQTLQTDHNNTTHNLNQGLFYLWTGNQADSKGFKIQVAFSINAQFANQYELVDPRGNAITSQMQVNQFIRSDVATKIDVKPYFDALNQTKINVTPGSTPGTVNQYQIPQLTNTSVLIWNKPFNEINKILNNLGIKFSFQAQNAQGSWSQWTENLNDSSLKTYLPSHPVLKIAASTTVGWSNTKIYYDNQDVSLIKHGLDIALNVPKLIAMPADFQNQINQQVQTIKPFGGTTYQLTIDQVDQFEAQLVTILKQASNPVNGSHDNLHQVLEFKYTLANFANLDANQLKTELANHQQDLATNAITMQVSLKAPVGTNQAEFVLDPQLANQKFAILANQNEVVKIYLHGDQYEAALDQISVSGDLNNLTYAFPQALNQFANGIPVNGLKMQWAYGLANNDHPTHDQLQWQDGQLPSDLGNLELKKLHVRIAHDDNIKYSVYGPQFDQTWQVGTIDLSAIKKVITIDRDWLKQDLMVPNITDVTNFSDQIVNQWISQVFAKSQIESEWQKYLTIEFQIFEDQSWIDAHQLSEVVRQAPNDFNAGHSGLVEFWDGSSDPTNKVGIKAKFILQQSAPITLVDPSGQVINRDEQLTNDVKVGKLQTTIDLTSYVNQLSTQVTTLKLNQNQPGTIAPGSLIPPVNTGTGIFANLTFSEIMDKLKIHQVEFEFATNLNQPADQWVWTTYEQTLSYDPQIAKMNIRLTNRSTNLKFQFGNLVDLNATSQAIELKLVAPKVITIEAQDFANLVAAFSGNTKHLVLNESILTNQLNAIKERHFQQSQNPDFQQMPLEMVVSVANQPFVAPNQLVSQLGTINQDLSNRNIKIKYQLAQNADPNLWSLSGQTEVEIASDQTSPLKYYVHDLGLWEQLKTTTFSGTNEQFIWNWPQGISVDQSTGVITNRQGLKIVATFNENLSALDEQIGSDPLKQWVSQLPTQFDLNQVANQQIYLKVIALDQNYVYQNQPVNVSDKIILKLDLQAILNLDAAWLKGQLFVDKKDLKLITLTDLDQYEITVFQQFPPNWSEDQKQLLTISYQFNNQTYNKAQLLNAIQNWNEDWGFLQLWNGSAGQQIRTTFTKANPNGNYQLNWTSKDQNAIIDTTNAITMIDFQNVLKWLTSIKIEFVSGQNDYQIKSIKIGQINIDAQDSFANKNWDDLAPIFNKFHLSIEYRQVANDQNPVNTTWSPDLNSIKQYDDRNQFQIRFKISDANKAKNVQLILDPNTTLNPNKLTSDPYTLNLKAALNIRLDQDLINQTFINAQNVIGGNTKNLIIDQNKVQQLIQAIKNANSQYNPHASPSFQSANLNLEFAIGQNPTQWQSLNDFTTTLSQSHQDQTSNQINFHFIVLNPDPQNPDFQVNSRSFILNSHQSINQVDQTSKVKYFIHTNDWETNAAKVTISGTNQFINWNFASFGNQNVITQNQQVFLKTALGNALQIDFTTNPSVNYQDPAVGQDHTKGWSTLVPNQLDLNINVLKIRIRPVNRGLVYQAAQDQSAQVHQIDLNIKKELYVEKSWLNQTFNVNDPSKLVSALTLNDILGYERLVKNQISDTNVANQVAIKYEFNGQNNLDAAALWQAIQALKQPQSANHGVVQLWNGVQGMTIKSTFTLVNPNGQYIFVDQNHQPINNPDQYYQTTLDTKTIIDQIDLRTYIQMLQQQPIEVVLGSQANTISQIKFPNHSQDGSQLSNLSWSQIKAILNGIGITIQGRPVLDPNNSNQPWVDVDQVNQYHPQINRIEIQFVLNPSRASNFQLSLINEADLNVNTSSVGPISLNLKAPLKLVISASDIEALRKLDHISGNTKFIQIDANKEQQIVDQIINQNALNNPAFNDLKSHLKIEYHLGTTQDQNDWYDRQQFINFLKRQTNNQTTNAISIRFTSDQSIINNQEFQIDPATSTLINPTVGNPTSKIKIYLHENGMEAKLDQIKITGTNDNFKWSFPADLTPLADGTFSHIPGLRIQYSTNAQITNTSFDQANSGWLNQQPSVIDPKTKILKVQLVGGDGYVYGPEYKVIDQNDPSPNWSVHQVDVSGIKSVITINLNALKTVKWSGTSDQIALETIKQLEQTALKQANTDPDFQAKIQFQYQIEWQNQILAPWNDLNTVAMQLMQFATDYQNQIQGLIKFNFANLNQFATIKIKVITNDTNYVLFDQATNQPISDQSHQIVDTSAIQTKFDLTKWFAILRQAPVILGQGSTTNDIKSITLPVLGAGSEFLSNWDFATIEKVFNFFGLKFEFQAPGSKTDQQWVSHQKIKDLNHNNELYFRIALDQTLVSNQQLDQFAKTFLITGDQGQIEFNGQNQYASSPIKLVIDLPIIISTNSQDLTSLFSDQFGGNTWVLTTGSIKQLAEQQVKKVLKDNSTAGVDLSNVDLKIEFSLDQLALNQAGATWFMIDQFVATLATSTTNWQTNQIQVRYAITNQATGQQYQISDDQAVISLAKNDTINAKVKKYIHSGPFWDDVTKWLIPQGTTADYQIVNLNDYINSLSTGLSISFNHVSEQANDTNWTSYIPTQQNLPKPLGVDKNLWIRLEIADSYQFADQDGQNQFSQAKKLDSSQIRALLMMQKQWLDLLTLSGNLINLEIDERPVFDAIQAANVLPNDQNDLIQLQYRIKGFQQWWNQEQLKQTLSDLKGKKDDSRWILTHQDLEIRFHLNDPNNQYILNVDGTNISDENISANISQIFKMQANGQLDTKGVKAIINLDHFQQFNVDNFAISGNAATPLLTIKNQAQLDQQVSPYASEQLFKIEYSELWDQTNGYDWNNNRSLLKTDFSGFRDQDLFIQDGIQIHSNKKMAFRFITNNQDFELQSSTQQISNNAYLLDVSDRIQVTTQIENPFTKAQKSLAILTTNDDGSAQFDQGLGQFKIVVGNRQNQPEINGTTSQLASDFIKQAFNQSPEFIDKVEFVYQVFDHQPDQSEIDQAKDPAAINDYGPNSQWKQFNFNTKDGFSQGLKLKVNDYLMVALRIKQEFAFGQNAYQLLNNDHSVLIPVHQDQTTPGRVKGLFVDPTQINVNSLNLQSTLTNVSDLLDGWAAFNDLSLSDDQNNNLAGLDFELEFFSQFYEKNGAILISGSNSKLIKREQSGMIQGVQYVDQDGNLMTDDQSQPIYLWTDPKTNRLSAPISANQATLKLSTKIDQNRFFIENATDLKASLFKNQKVNLVFKARNNDFTLKNAKTIALQERINNQLKFPVENAQNVLYDFANRDAFLSDQIKYEGIDGQKPVEKAAKVKTVLQLSRQLKTDSSQSTIISGQNGFEAITKISEQIEKDFAGQLKLTYQYKTKDGAITNYDNGNFYQETKLVNGDQIILKLTTVANDLVFVDRPNDLIINIANLAVDAPEPDLLKFLRVEQSGSVDGKGSFRVLVNDPNKPVIDNEQTLNGFQFLVRVWDANQNVKIKWTSDQSELSNLRNGDRVEWKLVDEFKNPVKDAYYNTIAMPHDGKNLKFAQVNYPEGQASQQIVSAGIGDYPENDQQYPADSGFVINGLADSSLKFNLTQFAFEKIINTLNPTYRGQNGNGALMFNDQYMSGTWYVDLEGNVYQEAKYPDQKRQLQEIDLTTFFNHTTFYLQNPVTNPAQVGFKFKANLTNTGNQLKNGDQVWATFSIESDDQVQNQSDLDPSAILTTQLPDVNNLSDATDPLAALWWILIILGTLGVGALAWFFVKRKNKLKVKG